MLSVNQTQEQTQRKRSKPSKMETFEGKIIENIGDAINVKSKDISSTFEAIAKPDQKFPEEKDAEKEPTEPVGDVDRNEEVNTLTEIEDSDKTATMVGSEKATEDVAMEHENSSIESNEVSDNVATKEEITENIVEQNTSDQSEFVQVDETAINKSEENGSSNIQSCADETISDGEDSGDKQKSGESKHEHVNNKQSDEIETQIDNNQSVSLNENSLILLR